MISNTYIRKAKSWSEFSSSLNSLIDNNKKLQAGKIYEKCVQLFLQTNPKYQAALKNEAKKIISKYKFKDRLDYTKFIKKNELKNIPKDTYGFYKRTGEWLSWDDFLGKK